MRAIGLQFQNLDKTPHFGRHPQLDDELQLWYRFGPYGVLLPVPEPFPRHDEGQPALQWQDVG